MCVMDDDVPDSGREIVRVLDREVIDPTAIVTFAVVAVSARIVVGNNVQRVRRTLRWGRVSIADRIVEPHHAQKQAESGGKSGRYGRESPRLDALVVLGVSVSTQVGVEE